MITNTIHAEDSGYEEVTIRSRIPINGFVCLWIIPNSQPNSNRCKDRNSHLHRIANAASNQYTHHYADVIHIRQKVTARPIFLRMWIP